MKIKNLLFQPVTLHLYNGEGLHLNARETRDIPDVLVSGEIRLAEMRGLVSIIGDTGNHPTVPEEPVPDLAETAVMQADSVTTQKKGNRK
ncbi:MAG: hypothetical protein ACYC27_04650 [Armatimonadota bacterium]